jgi:hypothetical protein
MDEEERTMTTPRQPTGLKVDATVYRQIVELRRQGVNPPTIGKQLGLAKATAQRYAERADAELSAQAQAGTNGQDPAPDLRDVPLAQIEFSAKTQARMCLNQDTLTEYAERMLAGDHFPPVILYFDGRTHWIGDGFHRVSATRSLRGLGTTIRAEVRFGARRQALLYACSANATNGLPRSNADKRRAVSLLLQDEWWAKWSDGEIARHCRVTQPFVSKIRRELSQNDFEYYETDGPRLVRRGGTTYEMDTSQIGTRAPTPAPTNGQPAEEEALSGGLYGREVEVTPRRSGYEQSLDEIANRVLAFTRAIEQAGGITRLWQAWTRERQQEFREQMARIAEVWTPLTAEVEAAAPQTPLTLVPGEDHAEGR